MALEGITWSDDLLDPSSEAFQNLTYVMAKEVGRQEEDLSQALSHGRALQPCGNPDPV